MGIVWNAQTVEWFYRAAEYTGYPGRFAALLMEHISKKTTLCDVGCGAGTVDFALAPQFEHITCVDMEAEAIRGLEAQIRKNGIVNITPLCMDATQLEGRWDTVTALFHGGGAIEKYFSLAEDCLILATYMNPKGNFGPKRRKAPKRYDAAEMAARLEALCMTYAFEEHTLEYGQPLRDWAEAQAFVRSYTLPMEQEELDGYLAGHLQTTGREDFPYYLPNEKRIGLFVIRRDENERV